MLAADAFFIIDSAPPHPDSNVVGAEWLFKWKADVQGMIAKAKAYYRGFNQILGKFYVETFPRAASPSSVKLAALLAFNKGWDLHNLV